MTHKKDKSNESPIAPLANVSICLNAMQRAINRASHLPGMVCLYGPSGWGKSTAAAYVMNETRAVYVEAKSVWTRKSLIINILRELYINEPRGTVADLVDKAGQELSDSKRPLIIDEMDHIAAKNAVEVVRDLYISSGEAPILLIGEERLPDKLKAWERFHGRVLDWVPAQPASLADVKNLAQLYCNKITIKDDLLTHLHKLARGSVRRICVNLERIQEVSLGMGLKNVGLEEWQDKELFTGEATRRTVAA